MADRQLSAALSRGHDFHAKAMSKSLPVEGHPLLSAYLFAPRLCFSVRATSRRYRISKSLIYRNLQKLIHGTVFNSFELPRQSGAAGWPFHLEAMEQLLVRLITLASSSSRVGGNHAFPCPFAGSIGKGCPLTILVHPHRLLGPLYRAFGILPRCFYGSPA